MRFFIWLACEKTCVVLCVCLCVRLMMMIQRALLTITFFCVSFFKITTTTTKSFFTWRNVFVSEVVLFLAFFLFGWRSVLAPKAPKNWKKLKFIQKILLRWNEFEVRMIVDRKLILSIEWSESVMMWRVLVKWALLVMMEWLERRSIFFDVRFFSFFLSRTHWRNQNNAYSRSLHRVPDLLWWLQRC